MCDKINSIIVLVSGSGSNLQSLIDNIENGNINAKIHAIISDREGVYAQKRAEKFNIPFYCIKRKDYKKELSNKILDTIGKNHDLIVQAGFLSILKGRILEIYKNKIINIHPSLLPKYGGKGMYGLNVHKAVIDSKETKSGCTVHYVDKGIDSGKIIEQIEVPVYKSDTPEILQKRILEQEHILLPKVIKKLITNNFN